MAGLCSSVLSITCKDKCFAMYLEDLHVHIPIKLGQNDRHSVNFLKVTCLCSTMVVAYIWYIWPCAQLDFHIIHSNMSNSLIYLDFDPVVDFFL